MKREGEYEQHPCHACPPVLGENSQKHSCNVQDPLQGGGSLNMFTMHASNSTWVTWSIVCGNGRQEDGHLPQEGGTRIQRYVGWREVAVRIKLIIEESLNNEVRLVNFCGKISNGKLVICNKNLKTKPSRWGNILTNWSSKLYMGKHSQAIDSIVVHIFVGFVIQHIISISAFLIMQFL